jgi:hypothetical protein
MAVAGATLGVVVLAMWGGTLGLALHQDDYWQAAPGAFSRRAPSSGRGHSSGRARSRTTR